MLCTLPADVPRHLSKYANTRRLWLGDSQLRYRLTKDLLHERRDEWLSLILLKVLQTQSSPIAALQAVGQSRPTPHSACSISQPAWNFRRAEAWSQPSTFSLHLAIRSLPLRFRPKPRHLGGKALIPQQLQRSGSLHTYQIRVSGFSTTFVWDLRLFKPTPLRPCSLWSK